MIARRFVVRGRVQGVGFRYFVTRAARYAGVVGSVRNLPDGNVEAVAEGSPEALTQFRRQLECGPSTAHVTSVDEVELPVTGRYTGFAVDY